MGDGSAVILQSWCDDGAACQAPRQEDRAVRALSVTQDYLLGN
jgi:hypothetical protein